MHPSLRVVPALEIDDPTYAQAQRGCVEARAHAAGDEDALFEVDRICQTVEVGFAFLREHPTMTAERAIDEGVHGVDAEALSAGLGAWMELQELVRGLR